MAFPGIYVIWWISNFSNLFIEQFRALFLPRFQGINR